jgi:mannonate dehydratase
MKIKSAKVIVTCPGRNFVTLKIETDDGFVGLGDATLNGRELAVVAFLEEHCIPALVGMDARNTEDIFHYFYRGVYWRRGAVGMAALSAIDVALWDLKARSLNTPLYNLLGGKSRGAVNVYGHASGASIEAALEQVAKYQKRGYRYIRVQAAVPDVRDSYGVQKGGGAYEPAKKGIASVESWDTEKYLQFAPRLFDAVRSRFGDGLHLLHDVHHRCTPIEAARLAKSLEPYHLFWLEDPVAGELQEGLRLIRQHSTTPIAIGEVFNTVYDYTTLLSEQLIDFVRLPPSHGGGITHAMKLAAMASVYHVRTGFHGATDISPVGLAAALHVDIAVNNFGLQEHMGHEEIVSEVFSVDYRYENGQLHLGEAPGLGVSIDEDAALRFKYEPAQLPIARLEDGTQWHW